MKKNLYVWEDFIWGGYTTGLAFAIADSMEQAKQMVAAKSGESYDETGWGEVKILSADDSVAFAKEGVS